MAHKIVIKNLLLISLIFINLNIVQSQEDSDYYSLFKGGKKYLKPIRYLLLNKEEDLKITSNDFKEIIFYKKNQRFKHKISKNERDTCSILALNKLKTITIKKLFEDEFTEHKSKLKLEKVNFPQPPDHYNLKIFMIEIVSDEKIVKYEVEWIYTLK